MIITREVFRRSWRSWVSYDVRSRGPEWLLWLWTTLLGVVVAVGFTMVGATFFVSSRGDWPDVARWWKGFQINLVISLCIAYTIHLLFLAVIPLVGTARIRRFTNGQRGLFFSAIPMLGVMLGWPLGMWLVGQDVARWVRHDSNSLAGSALLALLIGFIIFLFFDSKARELEADKRATEAQLRLLQGQIEPHFLFNTLANVQSLIESDTPKAKRMLEAFSDYLRSSLLGLRRGDSTLGAELDLAEAYLRLLQSRMEGRLRFTIEADDDARRFVLPPLLLQPLVENAIVHGLEPKIEGGSLSVRATRRGGTLVIEVLDDGRGLEAPARHAARSGNGMALDNIRERLQSRYGDESSLELVATPSGTRATLRLPLETDAP